ncbi:MAG: FAD-dependent monooxygenase [Pseudomonadota bacterium]
MKPAFSITVVGAGMTGLLLAALLSRDGRLAVRVIDAGPPPVYDPEAPVGLRVSALAPASVGLLECVGAWSGIIGRRACGYERMRVWDASAAPDGPATVRFDADEFALAELGFIVENELVRHALCESLAGSPVVLEFDAPLSRVERGSGVWRYDTGNGSADAELLIGADGGRSIVREAAGIESFQKAYEQHALVTHVEPERPHAATARQRFLPSGPLGLLPLDDGRISIVWSTTPEEAGSALDLSDADLGRRLGEVSDHVLGELRASGARGVFPLRAAHAEHYVEAGLALIGDAAHSVHPLAGQGANLGFADAAELAGVILAALDAGEYPADRPVLRRYERARRGANAGMMNLLTGLNRLFAADSALVGEFRKTGMLLFNRSGPIREKAVDIALGVSRR